jgi:hypothetical protein
VSGPSFLLRLPSALHSSTLASVNFLLPPLMLSPRLCAAFLLLSSLAGASRATGALPPPC